MLEVWKAVGIFMEDFVGHSWSLEFKGFEPPRGFLEGQGTLHLVWEPGVVAVAGEKGRGWVEAGVLGGLAVGPLLEGPEKVWLVLERCLACCERLILAFPLVLPSFSLSHFFGRGGGGGELPRKPV